MGGEEGIASCSLPELLTECVVASAPRAVVRKKRNIAFLSSCFLFSFLLKVPHRGPVEKAEVVLTPSWDCKEGPRENRVLPGKTPRSFYSHQSSRDSMWCSSGAGLRIVFMCVCMCVGFSPNTQCSNSVREVSSEAVFGEQLMQDDRCHGMSHSQCHT